MGKRSRQDSVSSSEDTRSPTSREASVDVKIVHLDAGSALTEQPAVMKCSLPPHGPLTFASFEAYDVHYQKTHMNRCSECNKNFPDEHFLHLHIAENHDPISAAKRDQGEKMYACLVSSCDRFCSTPFKRRLHCIDKHGFPRNYDFFIVNDGIDRRSSMLRPPPRRRSSTVNSTTSATSRRRGESLGGAAAESMDIVKDEDGEDDEEEEDDEDENEDENKRTPVKLRGRGGFGHPRRAGSGRGRGRGRGHGRSSSSVQASTPSQATEASTAEPDPMDSLASSMSSLKFVPHSLYSRGKARGRGAG